MPMELLPEYLKKDLPPLYSTKDQKEPMAVIKYFTPDANWTWYIIEGEEQENGDWLFFAYVIGLEKEYGYVLLSELESVKGPLGLSVERDLYFQPIPMSFLAS